MSEDPPEQRLSLSEPACMVVEDEVLIGMALEDELGEAGFRITGPFARCADALASLDRDRPAVALLDTVLKDGSCLDLARELIRRNIPFVIYSGQEQHHASAPEFDGVPWVVKPAPYQEVVAAVRQAMRPSSRT